MPKLMNRGVKFKMLNMPTNENNIFIDKFNSEENGFYDLNSFVDNEIGFSIKKKLNEGDSDNTSLISIYIPDKIFKNKEIEKKPLSIHATYGKIVPEGVTMRSLEKTKFTDPVDAEYTDEYFYNIRTKDIYRKDKIISADELLNEVYGIHIKPTKPVRGFCLRMKMFFWRILMNSIFKYASKFLSILLYIVSGDRYSYDPIFKERNLNGGVIKSDRPIKRESEKPEAEEGKKISFLGYKASPHCILFYSLFHFLFYIIFIYSNYQPEIITKIFKNNFLTLTYVMMSLIVIDKIMPKILMLLIDTSSTLSLNSLYWRFKL